MATLYGEPGGPIRFGLPAVQNPISNLNGLASARSVGAKGVVDAATTYNRAFNLGKLAGRGFAMTGAGGPVALAALLGSAAYDYGVKSGAHRLATDGDAQDTYKTIKEYMPLGVVKNDEGDYVDAVTNELVSEEELQNRIAERNSRTPESVVPAEIKEREAQLSNMGITPGSIYAPGGLSNHPLNDEYRLAQAEAASRGGDWSALDKRLADTEIEKQEEISRKGLKNWNPEKPNIDQLAKDVLAGKFGNGEERVKALDSNYPAVQKRVNELIAKNDKGSSLNFNWADLFNALLPAVALGGLGYLGYRKLR